MKLLLDACVLYPTVLREILIGCARAGLYTPLWSARILEEWARATVKLGPQAEVFARGEIAMLRAAFPNAEVLPRAGLEAGLHLPDENDIHVLASAITSGADAIVVGRPIRLASDPAAAARAIQQEIASALAAR